MGNLSNNKITTLIRRGSTGDHTDGAGLRLRVKEPRKRKDENTCSAVWILAYRFAGKQRNIQLGEWPGVDTFDAQERAEQVKEAVARDTDPSSMFQTPKAVARAGGSDSPTGVVSSGTLASLTPTSTFAEVAHRHHENISESLKSEKYRKLWIASLRPALDAFGSKLMGEVGVRDVEAILRLIWTSKHITAKRLAQRTEQVFEYARGAGVIPSDQPSLVKAALAVMPRYEHEEQHFESLPYPELPAFWVELDRREAMSARCLQFSILTATRSQEVRGARWAEIDESAGTWTIPGERIKTRKMKQHTVYLTDECFELLDRVRGVDGDNPLAFPSETGLMMSVNVFRPLFRRMGRVELGPDGKEKIALTQHGFRATYRAFCEEMTDVDPSIIEMSYGHVVGTAVERAYRREAVRSRKVKELMATWTRFATGKVSLGDLEAALDD